MLRGFERALLRRHLRTTAIILALLLWVVVILLVSRFILKPIEDPESRQWRVFGLYVFRSLEFIFPLALALGFARTVITLRAQGVIDPIVASGYAPRRWRLVIGLVAAFTCFGSILIYEGVDRFQTDSPEMRDRLWPAIGDQFTWRIPVEVRSRGSFEALTFGMDSFDLSVAKRTEIRDSSLHLFETATLVGASVAPDEYPRIKRQRSFRSIPPISRWPTSGVTMIEILAGFDRLAWGALLLVLVGYGALLIPPTHNWVTYALLPVLVCLLGLASARSTSLVWAQTSNAPTLELLVLVIFIASWLWLDHLLRRRGLGQR